MLLMFYKSKKRSFYESSGFQYQKTFFSRRTWKEIFVLVSIGEATSLSMSAASKFAPSWNLNLYALTESHKNLKKWRKGSLYLTSINHQIPPYCSIMAETELILSDDWPKININFIVPPGKCGDSQMQMSPKKVSWLKRKLWLNRSSGEQKHLKFYFTYINFRECWWYVNMCIALCSFTKYMCHT